MSGLECGHRTCNSCWTQYLTMKIMSDGMGQTISCAALDCNILIDDATVMKLVTDPEVRKKYLHLITNSFVQVWRIVPFKILTASTLLIVTVAYSAIGICDGAQAQVAAVRLKWRKSNHAQWRVPVVTRSALLVAIPGTNPYNAPCSSNGSKNATRTMAHQSGSPPIPRSVTITNF